jgi:hypothetical protein
MLFPPLAVPNDKIIGIMGGQLKKTSLNITRNLQTHNKNSK